MELADAFAQADGVVVSQVARLELLKPEERLDPAMLMADLNGIAKAGHVREKLVQLVSYAETLRGLTRYAALRSRPCGGALRTSRNPCSSRG